MKILKNTNIIPVIIIIFCFLIFFGIIHNKKVKKINDIMESFTNSEKSIEDFNNRNKNKSKANLLTENNTDFSVEYIAGNWTTPNTKLDSNNMPIQSTLMKIKLNDDKTGEIYLPKIDNDMFYTGITYKISIPIIGLNIIAESDKSDYILSISFVNTVLNNNFGKDELILSTNNIPTANIEFQNKIDKNVKLSLSSFKLSDGLEEIGGQLKKIISSKNYLNKEIKDIYGISSYLKIIRDYKFKEKTISFSGKQIVNNNSRSVFNKIRDNYNNTLSFSIARQFYTPTGSIIKTFSSKVFNLDVDKNFLPEYINIIPIKDDGNRINFRKYTPKSTIIYFYKVTKTSVNYYFNNKTKINNNIFSFMNNGNAIVKANINDMDDLNNSEKLITSDYTMTQFKTIPSTPNDKNIIRIQFKELYGLI